MGNSISYTGEFFFTTELSDAQRERLESYFDIVGIDGISHKAHIAFEYTLNEDGIQWTVTDHNYYIDEILNYLIDSMQIEYPDFGLEGEMLVQGEDVNDRYLITIVDGRAISLGLNYGTTYVECPKCKHKHLIAIETEHKGDIK
jgi:hypothetical protein